TDGHLFIPTVPNFPCLDLFLAPDGLFQVTVSSNHPVKQAPLKDIAESILGNNWNATNKELRLYFVVPSDIYDNFMAQNYLTTAGAVSQNIFAAVQRVKQYALKFDLDAALAGNSPGVGNGTAY